MRLCISYIAYGIEVYANCSQAALDKLIKTNNKILRILLCKNNETHNVELYRLFNVLPIPLLHKMKLLQLVHKFHFHKNLLPEAFQDYFVFNSIIHEHHTRNKNNLHVSFVNSGYGQRNCVYRASKFWNDLPSYLKIVASTELFQNSLNKYLLWR